MSNPVPSEDGNGFVPFEELGQTGTGFLSSSDAAMNGYLEAILGTYGIRALSKSDYEDSKKKDALNRIKANMARGNWGSQQGTGLGNSPRPAYPRTKGCNCG